MGISPIQKLNAGAVMEVVNAIKKNNVNAIVPLALDLIDGAKPDYLNVTSARKN
jgi:hypothetical protein